MATLSASATGTGTVVLTISGLQYPANQYVQFQVNNNNTSVQYVWTDSGTSTSTSYTATGLTAGTTYTFTGYANYGGTNFSVGTASATTLAPSPVPQPTNISLSANGKTINMSWSVASGTYVDWEGDWGGSGWSNAGVASTTAPNYSTRYGIRFKSEGNGTTTSDSAWTGYYYVTTGSLPTPRPSAFSWTFAKQSGGTYNLKASEWKSLIQNVNDVRVYRGLGGYSWTYNILANINTGVTFTASMYNEVWDAISSCSPVTALPARASSGSAVLASMLNGLVSSINSVP